MGTIGAGAQAKPVRAKGPHIQMRADHTRSVSRTASQLSGNVVIKMGATEIKTDEAQVVTGAHNITVYTDAFVATARK